MYLGKTWAVIARRKNAPRQPLTEDKGMVGFKHCLQNQYTVSQVSSLAIPNEAH
jgi:hypothetical protein